MTRSSLSPTKSGRPESSSRPAKPTPEGGSRGRSRHSVPGIMGNTTIRGMVFLFLRQENRYKYKYIYIYTRMYVIWPSLDIIYHYRSIIVSGGYPENSFYYYYSLLDNRSLLMSHISILCWTSPFFWGSSVGSVGSARPCTEVKQEMCSVSDAMREYTKERRFGMTDW